MTCTNCGGNTHTAPHCPIEEADFGLAGARAIVSVTAFPPGAPSRMMHDVPLFEKEPPAEVIPAAWFKA